jgi:chromosome segregation ATPase
VVAVQRDTQSLVEEKTTALSAATQQAHNFSAKVTLLEAALSREKESTQEAFAKQEEAEARTVQLEALLRALESELAHFNVRQPELEQQLREAQECADSATREVQDVMENLATSESNCRDAESARMSLLGELEVAAAGLASSEEQLKVANRDLLSEQQKLVELNTHAKATLEKDRAANAQALHELEQKCAHEVEALAKQHACALEAMATEVRIRF